MRFRKDLLRWQLNQLPLKRFSRLLKNLPKWLRTTFWKILNLNISSAPGRAVSRHLKAHTQPQTFFLCFAEGTCCAG